MAITGSGTSVDPYVIYDLDDLELVGTSPYTLDKYYKLNNDIDASATADPGYNSGAGWLPIGTFTGNFNGDGHAITGLYINRGATNYVGFISIVNGGTVTGLTISNGSITGGQYTGAVVGGNSTSSTVIVTNCVNNNTTVTGTGYVGGIIGGSAVDRNATGTITGNSCSGTVTGTSYVGGILGVLRHFNFTLSNNTVTGQINNSGNYTGGIAGAVNRGAVQYNEMTGTFGTLAHYVGGILGWLTSYSLTITNNTVACNIPASGYDYIGGIVGILKEGSYTLTFNENSYEGDISGRNYVGGLAGQDGNYDYTNSYIKDCTVKGSLTATGSQIGGVYGRGRGSVKNITLNSEEFTITVANTSDYVGGIVGYSMWSHYVENCQVNVAITGARDYIGGIVGGSNASSGHIINITNCQVEANIGGRNGIGGITGQCDTYGTTGITLNGCSYKGTITSTGDSCGGLVARNRVVTLTGEPSTVEATINGASNVGGAFGLLWVAQSPNCSLIKFKNTVVNGTGTGIGGIVGQLYREAGLENADLNGADITVNGSVNSDYVGGIVGKHVPYSTNTQLIKKCKVTGLQVTGRDYVGGISGNIGAYGTIQQCNAIFVDVTGRDRVGGLCGSADSNAVITVSYSTGQVTGTGSHHGGLVGYFNLTGGFSNCYSHCAVNGVTNVGGLIGYCGQNISTCYSKGQVSGTTAVGGLVGYIPGAQTATECFWDTQTSGQANSAIGTGKTTAEMKTEGTYTNYDFVTSPIWVMPTDCLNEGYPYLYTAQPLPTGSDYICVVDSAGTLTLEGIAPELVVKKFLYPSGIESGEAFGAITFNFLAGIPGIQSEEAFGTPQLNFKIYIEGITSGEALGDVNLVMLIKPEGIASEEIWNNPQLNQIIFLQETFVPEVFGDAQLNLQVRVTGIESAEEMGAVRVVFLIQPGGISTEEAVGNPILNFIIHSNWGSRGEEFGNLKLLLYLLVNGIASEEALGDVNVIRLLQPMGISTEELFGSPQLNMIIKSLWGSGGEEFGILKMIMYLQAEGFWDETAVPGMPKIKLYLKPLGILSEEYVSSGINLAFDQWIVTLGIPGAEGFGIALMIIEQFLNPEGIVSEETIGMHWIYNFYELVYADFNILNPVTDFDIMNDKADLEMKVPNPSIIMHPPKATFKVLQPITSFKFIE